MAVGGWLADNPKLILTLDRVRIGKNCLLIIFLLLINKFDTLGNVLSYIILLAIALRNVEGALKALSISGLMIVANSVLVTRGDLFTPLKFLLLIAAIFCGSGLYAVATYWRVKMSHYFVIHPHDCWRWLPDDLCPNPNLNSLEDQL